MKGIILAGGAGTRLRPATLAVSKQLLPVGGKPMAYYPLTLLMLAGIRDILVITTEPMLPLFRQLLGDGSRWGVTFSYAVQNVPRGLPDAFLVGREFIGDDTVCLVLGDNVLYGSGLSEMLQDAATLTTGAVIYGYRVETPERYGVIVLNRQGEPAKLIEKPATPISDLAIPGIYMFDASVIEHAEELKPSKRQEVEIIDLLQWYLKQGTLDVRVLDRGFAWFDAGDVHELHEASGFVLAVERRQRVLIGSPEEVAFRMGFIDIDQLCRLRVELGQNRYGTMLNDIVKAEGMRRQMGL